MVFAFYYINGSPLSALGGCVIALFGCLHEEVWKESCDLVQALFLPS